jgi:hypothetical protein
LSRREIIRLVLLAFAISVALVVSYGLIAVAAVHLFG